MNNHGIHTIASIFNLALTLHTVREWKSFLGFCRLKTAPNNSISSQNGDEKKFSSTFAQSFFFTLRRKLLITCNVITLRKPRTGWGKKNYLTRWEHKQQSIRRNRPEKKEHQAGNSLVISFLSCSLSRFAAFVFSDIVKSLRRKHQKTISCRLIALVLES